MKNSYSRLQVQRYWNHWQDEFGSFLVTAEQPECTRKATSLEMPHSAGFIMDCKLTLMLLDLNLNTPKVPLNRTGTIVQKAGAWTV